MNPRLLKALKIGLPTAALGISGGAALEEYLYQKRKKKPSGKQKLFTDYWNSLDRKQQSKLNEQFEKQKTPDLKGFADKTMSDPDKPKGKRRQRSDKGRKRGKYRT